MLTEHIILKNDCSGQIDWVGVGAYMISVSNEHGFYHEYFFVIPASCKDSFRLIKWTVNGWCKYMFCPFIFLSWCTILLNQGINRQFRQRVILYKLYHERYTRIYYLLVNGLFNKITVWVKHRLRFFAKVGDHCSFYLLCILWTD